MTSIVICGLVRDEKKLKSKILEFTGMRSRGLLEEIVYSTWIGEIDKHAGLRNFLKTMDIKTVEIEEPKLVLKGGHQLHQMVSFHYGMDRLTNKDQFVLKTRVDLAENNPEMESFFADGTTHTTDFLSIGLSNKILVEYAQMNYPFLCGDAQFFGHFRDLQKLINLSNKFETIYNRLAVEQTFFFSPFEKIRIFQEHFLWNLPHISEASNNRYSQLEKALSNKNMSNVMALWWRVLDSYFTVGWHRSGYEQLDEEPKPPSLLKFHLEGQKVIGNDSSDLITSSGFVDKYLLHSTNNVIDPKFLEKRDFESTLVSQSIFEEYEDFRKTFSDLPSAKGARFKAEDFVVFGAAQHFFVKDQFDNAASRYHEQVTHLRRENDNLKKLLNVSTKSTRFHRFLSSRLSAKRVEVLRKKLPRISRLYAKYFMTKTD